MRLVPDADEDTGQLVLRRPRGSLFLISARNDVRRRVEVYVLRIAGIGGRCYRGGRNGGECDQNCNQRPLSAPPAGDWNRNADGDV